MSTIRTTAVTVRLGADSVGALVGLLVAGITFGCLIHPDLGLFVSRGVALLAGLSGAGVAFYLCLLGDRSMRATPRLVSAARLLAVTGFAAALTAVAFEIMVVAGTGLRGLGDPLSRADVLQGGQYVAAVVAGLGLVAIALWVGAPAAGRSRWLAVAGGLVVCGSFLLTGHARTHGPSVLVVVCGLAHVIAAAAWLGGLVGLGVALAAERPARFDRDIATSTGPVLVSFAALMTGVIVMLLCGGVALGALYLHSVTAITATAYGRVLLVKVSLVAAVLGVSVTNHRRLVPAASAGDRGAVRALRMTITIEQIGLVGVLLITTLLSNMNPGG